MLEDPGTLLRWKRRHGVFMHKNQRASFTPIPKTPIMVLLPIRLNFFIPSTLAIVGLPVLLSPTPILHSNIRTGPMGILPVTSKETPTPSIFRVHYAGWECFARPTEDKPGTRLEGHRIRFRRDFV